mmetsp:Transcript_5059/g.7633  ORF Transcript_5059/g.7633 Transcript_5059/m.7633 type:complete len:101 (+) Transcript_5059:965-1267(+)
MELAGETKGDSVSGRSHDSKQMKKKLKREKSESKKKDKKKKNPVQQSSAPPVAGNLVLTSINKQYPRPLQAPEAIVNSNTKLPVIEEEPHNLDGCSESGH